MPMWWSRGHPRSLGHAWRAAGDQLKRDVRAEVREAAREIMERSRQFAPVDKGNLEAAHNLRTRRSNSTSLEIDISVGGSVGGVNVSQYAMIMHEGEYNVGELSQAKAAALGVFVGPKFLERALEEGEPKVIQALERLLGRFG